MVGPADGYTYSDLNNVTVVTDYSWNGMTYTSFNSTYNPTFTVYNIPEADITKICAIEVTGFQFVSTISSKFARAELPTPTLTVTSKVANGSGWDVTFTPENFTENAKVAVLKYTGTGTPAAFAYTNWGLTQSLKNYAATDFYMVWTGSDYSSVYSRYFLITSGVTFKVTGLAEADITNICLIEATGNATTTESNFAQATVPPAPTASIASTSVTNGGSVCSGTIVTLTASAENLGATTPSYVWEKKNSDETYTPVTGASGTNNEELILYSLSTPGTYTYHVKATADGTFSADYTFTIKPIYTPSDVTVTISAPTGTNLNKVSTNSSVTLTAAVTPEALQNSIASYAWYNGGNVITGETSATYTYAAGSTATTANITCKVMFNNATTCQNESLATNGKTSDVKAITVVAPKLTATSKVENGSGWDVTFKAENFTNGAKVAVLKYTGTGTPAAFAYTNWGLTQSLKNYAATDFYVVWPGSDYSSVYSRYFLITSGVTFKVTGLAEADITKICLIEATGNATTTSSKFAQAVISITPTVTITSTSVEDGGSVCAGGTVSLTASLSDATLSPTWAWEKRSGDNFVAVTSTDGTADGATFTPNLATAGTYTYRATATVDGTEYPSAGFEFTVTANMPDIDAATPSSGNSMCAADDGMFITATDAPANGTNTYTWYKAVATVCPAETSPEWGESIFTSSTDRNYNISANELEAGNTYWFKVVATNTNYCGESVAYAPVIVKPAMPTLTLASDDYTSGEAVCAGTAGVITANFASTLTGTTEYSVEKSETETGEYEPFNYYGVVNTATGTMTFPQGALLADATGYYKVTATNPNYCGTAEAIFHLIVTPGLDQPEITATVGGAALNNEGTTCANNEITFTAKKVTGATYVEGTTFVWEYGTTENGITTWTAITGVSGKTASWTPTETGTYTLRVTASKESSCPTTSEVFEYTVNPVYSSNDVTVTIAAPAGTDLTNVIAGSTVTFTATVDAAGLDNDDFTFQWYKNGSAVAGVNGVTYDYPANLGEGHFGYVYCVATLNATGICQNANWNGIRGSNTATIIKIPDPNAIGSLGSLNASGITKYTAKLNWTKTNASDNVVVYLKQEATAGTPTLPTADGAPTANPVFNKNIANNIQVVYAGPATSVSISGLAKKTQYTAYAYICNADFAAASFSATNMRDTTFKTKSFKEAYEITDPDFEGEFSVSTVAPNPVTGDELNFNIQSINNANYEIELFSSNGEYITGMTQMLSEGIHSMKLDLNSQKGGLSTGAYILRVRSDGHTLSQPVRIVR